MSAALPKFIDPFFLARQEHTLAGHLPLSVMSRIADRLAGQDGTVYIDWLFCQDKQERPIITGTVKAQLLLQCQRCLKPVQWTIQTDVRLRLILPEETEEADVEDGYETLEVEHIPALLSAMVEDELILVLPIVAKHEECPGNEYVAVEEPAEETDQKMNPFRVLSQLKKSNPA